MRLADSPPWQNLGTRVGVPSCPQPRASPPGALHCTKEPSKPGKGIQGLVVAPDFSTT